MTLVVAVFAIGAMSAQTNKAAVAQTKAVTIEKKHECKDHKDGQPCTKPSDQQCDDCKAKAAEAMKHECKEGHKCDKAEGMKHECKEGMKNCDKAEGMKHECKEGMKNCDKAEGMKHECKEGHKCDKAEGMKHECKEAKKCDKDGVVKHDCQEGMKMHQECKDHKDGQPCTKPADQQCPDCKEKAAKKK